MPDSTVLHGFPTDARYWVPDRLSGPDTWVGHIPFAFWTIQSLRPRILVELGTGIGNSYLAFCQAIERLRMGTFCYALSSWRGDALAGVCADTLYQDLSSYHDPKYGRFSRLVRVPLDEAGEQFADSSIDLLHIVGLQTYASARQVFEIWRQKMSDRGVVLFHHTNVREQGFGVWQLWEELIPHYPGFLFLHSNGLGVLGVGQNLSEPFRDLLRTVQTPEGLDALRQTYARLGEPFADQLLLRRMDAHTQLLTRTLEQRDKDVVMLNGALSELRQGQAEANHQIDRLTRALTRSALPPTLPTPATMSPSDEGVTPLSPRSPPSRLQVVGPEPAARLGPEVALPLRAHPRWSGGLRLLKILVSRLLKILVFRLLDVGAQLLQAVAVRVRRHGKEIRALQLFGWAEMMRCDPLAFVLDLRNSRPCGRVHPLFDTAYYRRMNPDVTAECHPLAHYLRSGAAEGRNPHPLFDSAYYLRRNPTVAAAGINPLIHYIDHGGRENRDPHPLFDTNYYLAGLPPTAIPDTGRTPLEHFLEHYHESGRDPHPLFDSAYYLRSNPEVAAAGLNPLIHFIEKGGPELRNPNRRFDMKLYAQLNRDAAGSVTNPLLHYLAAGAEAVLYRPPSALAEGEVEAALGIGYPILGPLHIVAGIVLYDNRPEEILELVHSIRLTAAALPDGVTVEIRLLDNSTTPLAPSLLPNGVPYEHSGANLGFGKGHNAMMRHAFSEDDADFYLGVNPDGRLHPDCLTHLLRMAEGEKSTAGSYSLLEAIQFPEEHPKWYDPGTLDTPWVSGACFLMPRAIFRATQGFDENMFLYCEDVDLSWRVRLAGFRTRICPTAIFLHDVSDRGQEPWRFKEMLLAGRYLAHKWGSSAFRAHTEQLLLTNKMVADLSDLPDLSAFPLIDGSESIPDFDHAFSFAATRW